MSATRMPLLRIAVCTTTESVLTLRAHVTQLWKVSGSECPPLHEDASPEPHDLRLSAICSDNLRNSIVSHRIHAVVNNCWLLSKDPVKFGMPLPNRFRISFRWIYLSSQNCEAGSQCRMEPGLSAQVKSKFNCGRSSSNHSQNHGKRLCFIKQVRGAYRSARTRKENDKHQNSPPSVEEGRSRSVISSTSFCIAPKRVSTLGRIGRSLVLIHGGVLRGATGYRELLWPRGRCQLRFRLPCHRIPPAARSACQLGDSRMACGVRHAPPSQPSRQTSYSPSHMHGQFNCLRSYRQNPLRTVNPGSKARVPSPGAYSCQSASSSRTSTYAVGSLDFARNPPRCGGSGKSGEGTGTSRGGIDRNSRSTISAKSNAIRSCSISGGTPGRIWFLDKEISLTIASLCFSSLNKNARDTSSDPVQSGNLSLFCSTLIKLVKCPRSASKEAIPPLLLAPCGNSCSVCHNRKRTLVNVTNDNLSPLHDTNSQQPHQLERASPIHPATGTVAQPQVALKPKKIASYRSAEAPRAECAGGAVRSRANGANTRTGYDIAEWPADLRVRQCPPFRIAGRTMAPPAAMR